jgi:hypothetical protein
LEHLEPRMLLSAQPLVEQQSATTFVTLFSTGFESSEGYTTGLLGTQKSWFSLPSSVTQPTISTSNPNGGTQHFRVAHEPTMASGTQVGAYSPFLATMVDGSFRASVDVSISALGLENFYVVPLSASQELPTAEVAFAMTGHILIGNQVTFGSGGSWTDTGVSWVVGSYRPLVIEVNAWANTISYWYGGTSLGTSTIFAGTVVESVALGGDNYSAGATADYDNLVIERAAPPTVTDGNITLSGATGTGGAFRIGDTVTANWNNTAAGDANANAITAVTVDFSQFGGGAAVAAVNTGNVWTATYTIPPGTLDATARNVSVTATSAIGRTTTPDTTNATVDNQAPTLTAANISLAGATGSGGTFRIGDTVTASWNNTATGDANADLIESVTVDFSQFGGGAAVAAVNSGQRWTATYSLAAGTLEAANRGVTITVADNAGNARTVTDDARAAVDLVRPALDTLSPADDAADVPWEANLVIAFSENVQRGTGNVVIRLASDGSVVETIDVTGARVTLSAAQATIDPASALEPSTEYYVEVGAGAFQDLAGNAFAGISGATAWNITAASAANLDVDGNGAADALTDGILILRYLFDSGGAWSYSDALGANATRSTRPAIKSYLDVAKGSVLDVDGNGAADALTDGILILRYLFDRAGVWNYSDALGSNATRTTRDTIRAFLDVYNPNLAPLPGADSPPAAAEVVAVAAAEPPAVVEEPSAAEVVAPSETRCEARVSTSTAALAPQRVDVVVERWDRLDKIDTRLAAACAWFDASTAAGNDFGEEEFSLFPRR